MVRAHLVEVRAHLVEVRAHLMFFEFFFWMVRTHLDEVREHVFFCFFQKLFEKRCGGT